MRIKTIKRNTNYLLKMIDDFAATNVERMVHDLKELDIKSKSIRLAMFDMDILWQKNGKKSSKYNEFQQSLDMVSKIVGKKYDVLAAHDNHNLHIKSQISLQSDMAIRKLLLELETGGNVRFEDEQKDEAWVKECEALVKVFIKKTVTAHSPKAVQIHRLSKLHNRNLKLLLEGKLGPKMHQPNYSFHLCSKLKNSDIDAFEVVEHGFRTDRQLYFTNYIDFTAPDDIYKDGESSRRLNRALIVKVYTDRVQEFEGGIINYYLIRQESLQNIDKNEYQAIDAVFNVKTFPSVKPGSDTAKDYFIMDSSIVVPEYFIEYSLEGEKNKQMTKFERLALDIAYSNKLSHSNMPNIIGSLSNHFEAIPV